MFISNEGLAGGKEPQVAGTYNGYEYKSHKKQRSIR
jgi:hypothetical protein